MAMMPPPGEKMIGKKKKPGLAIAVEVGKPKEMPPPGELAEDGPPAKTAEGAPDAGGGKHTAEEAHPVRADQHCKDCRNYQAESGDCSKVDGYWDPEDACIRFFEAGGEDESAEDPMEEAGETPDEEAAEMPA